MIIMINGAFGVGKTTTSNKLVNKLENSMIFDPEEVGFMLRNIITNDIKHKDENSDDFQDLELWRKLTVDVAKSLIDKYNKKLIVPMTIRRYDYFKFIYNGFKNIDTDVHHFCLMAPLETIHKRLKERGDEEGAWSYDQTTKCIESFKTHDYSEYIDTENNDTDKVVDLILNKINI